MRVKIIILVAALLISSLPSSARRIFLSAKPCASMRRTRHIVFYFYPKSPMSSERAQVIQEDSVSH